MASKWHHSISMRQAHSVLAGSCVVYLDFLNSEKIALSEDDRSSERSSDQSVGNKPSSEAKHQITQLLESHVFLDHAAKNLGNHLREACISSDDALTHLVLQICGPDSKSCLVWCKVLFLFALTQGMEEGRPSAYPDQNSLTIKLP